MVVAIHAVLASGGCFVPVAPDSPVDRVGYVLGTAGVGVALAAADDVDRVAAGLVGGWWWWGGFGCGGGLVVWFGGGGWVFGCWLVMGSGWGGCCLSIRRTRCSRRVRRAPGRV